MFPGLWGRSLVKGWREAGLLEVPSPWPVVRLQARSTARVFHSGAPARLQQERLGGPLAGHGRGDSVGVGGRAVMGILGSHEPGAPQS